MNKNYYNYDSGVEYDCDGNGKYGKPCPPYQRMDYSYVIGNSIDFCVDERDREIKADITVNYRDSVRIWGQIRDCSNKPVPYAYLKLIKVSSDGGYEGIAHTMSDCLGFYQFDVCPCQDGTCFRILVGKASVGGKETVLQPGANCNNCFKNSTEQKCDCR